MRVAVYITQSSPPMREFLWTEFVEVVRDSISDHSVSIVSSTGAVTGPDRYGWVAEIHEPDAPLGKAALAEIAQEYGHPIEWLSASEASAVKP